MKKIFIIVALLLSLSLLSSCVKDEEQVTVKFELYQYNDFYDSYSKMITSVPSQTVAKGSYINPPKLQLPEIGRTFAGWYKDKLFTQPWDFNKDTLNVDTTLYGYYV